MNTSRTNQKKMTKKQDKNLIIITYDQFEQLLKNLSTQQARELSKLVKFHALIQHDPVRRIFQGTDKIMEEIQYLLNLKSEDHFTSMDSSFTQNDQTLNQTTINKQISVCYCLNISQRNYRSAMKELVSISALPHNVFQVVYSQKQVVFANRQEKNDEPLMIITNRCLNNKQIYMVFQSEEQILQLQAFVDTEFRLYDIQEMIRQMENRKDNIFKIELDEKQLYLFKKDVLSEWFKLISCINKTVKDEIVILMKYKYFKDFIQQRVYFQKNIKVVMDQSQIHLEVQQIGRYKVMENNAESIHRITNLAIQILSKTNRYLKHVNFLLDQISCFNFHLLEERKTQEMFVVRPSPKMTKTYVYFTFYRKLMLVQRNKETKSVQLKQRVYTEQITDKYYILALENIKKHAIINEIPFILLYDEAQNVEKIKLQNVQWQKQNQFCHLLAYDYILSSPKYKIVADAVFQKFHLLNHYEKPFKLTFNKTSPLYAVLGQCRSEEIIQKKRIVQKNVQKGYILAYSEYCRQFIKDRLLQYKST